MFRILLLALICGPRIIYSYFAWILKYSKNPSKYPLTERYSKTRDLILFVVKKMRIDLTIDGYDYLKNLKQKSLIIANHQSMIDIMLMISLSEQPIVFVGKAEVKRMPFVGKIMKAIDGEFLERDDPRQSIEVLRRASDRVKTGYSHVCIYPEGHRNRKPFGELLPYHAGSFKVATWNKAPILLVNEFGTFRILDMKLYSKRFPVFVKIEKPIEPSEFEGVQTTDYSVDIRDRMTKQIQSLMNYDKDYFANQKQKEPLNNDNFIAML